MNEEQRQLEWDRQVLEAVFDLHGHPSVSVLMTEISYRRQQVKNLISANEALKAEVSKSRTTEAVDE